MAGNLETPVSTALDGPAVECASPKERIALAQLNEDAWRAQYFDPQVSQDTARRALALADRLGDPLQAGYARLTLAVNEVRHGDLNAAMEAFTRLRGEFTAQDDQRGMLMSVAGQAFVELRRDNATAAYALLSDGSQTPLTLPNPIDTFLFNNLLGAASSDSGRTQEGLRYYYHSLNCANVQQEPALRAVALSNLGSSQHDAGNYFDAEQLLRSAYEVVATHGLEELAPLVAGNLAMCELALGNGEAAYQAIAPHLPTTARCKRQYRLSDQAFFLVIAAHTFIVKGNVAHAEALVDQAFALAKESAAGRVELHGWWVRGMIAGARGNPTGAREALDKAAALLDQIQDSFYPTQIHRALAKVLAELGEWEAAYLHLSTHGELLTASLQRAARARFETIQIQSELAEAAQQRDFARQRQIESERAQQELTKVNTELERRLVEIETLQAQLREQAIRDPLTRLFNRRYLEAGLQHAIAAAERSGRPLTVAMIDIDHFKHLNDGYGHPFGDHVLASTANYLQNSLRTSDICCRYGGEEFCVIFTGGNSSSVARRLRGILAGFHQLQFTLAETAVSDLSFSAGIAEFQASDNAETLIARADQALYRAKSLGRDRVELT